MISNAWMEQWSVWYGGEGGEKVSLIADRGRERAAFGKQHIFVQKHRFEDGLFFFFFLVFWLLFFHDYGK